MRAALYGHIDGPAVAVVGTWDPLMAIHQELFRQLSRYARRISLSSLAIMLHPPPPSLIAKSGEWPIYDDIGTRLALIKGCGIDAVVLINFKEQDLDAPGSELFEVIRPLVRLDELWLGAQQTLGRGPDASDDVILKLARRNKIHLQRLPPMAQPQFVDRARNMLKEGRLVESISLVGRPPVWCKPIRGKLKLAWPPGIYTGIPLDTPNGQPTRSSINIRLEAEKDGFSKIDWPDGSIKWLAFVSGPNDRTVRKKNGSLKTAETSELARVMTYHKRGWRGRLRTRPSQ